MHVKFLKEHEVKICDRTTKIYPVGWSGEIDDDLAKKAIKAKKAEEFSPIADDATVKPVDDGKKADAGKKIADAK